MVTYLIVAYFIGFGVKLQNPKLPLWKLIIFPGFLPIMIGAIIAEMYWE
jgi:threonine/homoserine/homoserine lactone efflux protein